MKKVIATVVAALSLSIAASAQGGIIAGLTMSSADAHFENFDPSTVNLYHVGLTYNVDLGILSVQPSIIYQMKGASVAENIDKVNLESFETKTGFLEVPVAVKAGLDLGLLKPYVFVEPFVGFALTTEDKIDGTVEEEVKKWSETAKNRLEYGFGFGAGIEFLGHFQLSGQYFMNMGGLYNEDGKVDFNAVSEAVQAAYGDKNNYKGFKISLAYLF